MKEKFRCKFIGNGFSVQYSYFGIFWQNAGEYVFKNKSDVEAIIIDLEKGICPDDWFKTKR